MTINLKVPDLTELKPRITVFGVGGAGGNAVNNMIERGLRGVEFVVANTDAQALMSSSAERRIQMGTNVTEGLGAGSKPEIGAAAAEEAMAEVYYNVTRIFRSWRKFLNVSEKMTKVYWRGEHEEYIAETRQSSANEWQDLLDTSIQTIKRMLRAG